jgi:raffinose/stachyose/melibiose transport system permease protein
MDIFYAKESVMDQSASVVKQRVSAKRKLRQFNFKSWVTPILFLLPATFFYIMFALYPMLSSLSFSLFKWDGLSQDRRFVGADNFYQIFFHDPVFWTAVQNSLIWVVLSLLVPVTVGLLFALVLNQQLFGRSTFRSIFYLPAILAGVAVARMWVWMYNPTYGIVNYTLRELGLEFLQQDWLGDGDIALYSVFVASVWQGTGINMVLFLAGLQGVSQDLLEAARVDGANAWQAFINVTVPALRPTFVIVIALTIINSLKAFDLIIGMTGGGPAQTTQLLALWTYVQSFGLHDFGKGNAVAVVLLIITLIVIIPYMAWTTREEET